MSILQQIRLSLPLMAATCLCLSGCIEYSTVVKVRKDGSGVVHVRNHEQKVGITIGGNEAEDDETKPKLPSQQQLAKLAKSMGTGVTLKSATPGKNRSGWDGYELIFEFEDVNQLVLNDNLTSFDDEADSTSDEAATSNERSTSKEKDNPLNAEFRFAMKDGKLEIRNIGFDNPEPKPTEKAKIEGASDPFAAAPAARKSTINLTETAMSEVIAKILADMRIGVFVEIDGEIESTNAIHRQDNLITLVSINVGKLLEGPDAKKNMQMLTDLKKSPNRREKTQELADRIDGFDIDLQNPIAVEFK